MLTRLLTERYVAEILLASRQTQCCACRGQHYVHGPRYLRPMSAIPGPRSWPFIGCIDAMQQGAYQGKLHKYIIQQHKKFGPIIKIKFSSAFNVVCLQDPQDIELLLKNDSQYPKRIPFVPTLLYNEQKGKTHGLFLR